MTVHANSVKEIGSDGTAKTITGATGQVYAGIVNGTVIAPVIAPETYQNQPYYPFNLTNFVVEDSSTTPPPPPPPPAPPVVTPSAPTGVAVALAGANQIAVSWNAAAGANHYMVERSSSGSAWTVAAALVTTTSYLDTGLAYATLYSYYIVAVSTSGATAFSAMVNAQTAPQPNVLSVTVPGMSLAREGRRSTARSRH